MSRLSRRDHLPSSCHHHRFLTILCLAHFDSIHRPRSENSIVAHNHPQTNKFSKPHLPLLLVHPPTQEEQDDEDDNAGAIDPNGKQTDRDDDLARLPPFSTFENPLRYQFPPVRASPPVQSLTHQLHHKVDKEARPTSPPHIARRIARTEVYSGNASVNSAATSKPISASVGASPSKNSPRSLFTRTELRIGSSPPSILCNASTNHALRNRQAIVDVHQRSLHLSEKSIRSKPESPERQYGSEPWTKSARTGPLPPSLSTATLSRSQPAVPSSSSSSTPPRSHRQVPASQQERRPSQQLLSIHQISSSSSGSSTSSRPPSQFHSTSTRSLYYPHAKASPFVAQRPRLFQRNSVSDIRMTESISPDRQVSSQPQQHQQYRRSGSPMSGQREETPTPTMVKREVPTEAGDAARETGEGKAAGSDPQRQAEAEEARDGLGKTPEFDFTARRHSLATSAFISPNGQAGNPLEPIRVGGAYHGQNAPTHPSPLGLGAGPIMPNSASSNTSSATRTVSGNNGSQAGGPPGPGSASFRKRKESHDRAAGYMESSHEGSVPGTLPSPAIQTNGPHHHQPPHHSSSTSNNPASSTSHNNVFQVPPPPVFSNPFGQHPSSSSTSIDRLEPPAKRRGSTYDSRMSHLSIAPTGSPPIGPGEGGPAQSGVPGGSIPANSWWNQQPDRRDSSTSMYSNRSLASSAGGYGSSTTSYSLMSDKGGYAPPPYSMSTEHPLSTPIPL